MRAPPIATRPMHASAFVIYHAAREANLLARAADKPRKQTAPHRVRTHFSSNCHYLLIWIVVKLQFSVKKNFIGLQLP
jgi:hypothetical protein